MREIAIILLSLICAVAMAAHPPEVKKVADEVVTEVAIDGDAEFFAAWNLEYPGLEAVKTAVENEDYDAAKVALKEYFLQRREPQWRISHWEMPEEPRGNAEDHSAYGEGEQILEHKFSGGGYEVDFDDEIDWNYFPKKLPNGKPDTEYPVIHYINRFGHLNTLGKLYWFSHDEKYAREFVDQITDHIEKNPAPEEYIRYTSVWSRLTAAVPLNGSWLNAYNYFLPSEHFTPEAHAMMLRRFIEKARYAIVAPDRVNRYMAQLTGVYATGAYFPELEQAEGFRELGELGIRKAAQNEFYPDGMSKELCPGYHGGSRGAITRLIDFAEIFGYAPPMDVLEILRQTYLIYPKITTPLRGLPDFGDTWGPKDGVVVRIFKDICNKYNDTPEIDEAITDPVFEWFSTEGAEGHAPEFTSTRMPWAGFYAMRSGWDRDALYLCADLGPLGAGHWHEDFSNFECYAYGQRLIADMSTHSYTTSIWKNYFYSSPAHNVVLVDGLSQDRAADASETLYIDEPGTDDWHSDDVFDLAWGEYDDRWVDYTEYTGWVNRFGAEAAVHLATHRREFAFIKDSYWIISDRLKAEGEHEYSQLFHVEPNTEAAVFGRKSAGTVGEGIPTVRIIQADEVSAEVIVGREEPIQGWMATGHGTKQEAGCISFNQTAEDEAVFDTVLLPLQAGEQPDLTVERIPVTDTDGNTIPVAEICALKITTPEGTDLYINDLRQTAIGPANGKMKTAGALSTDARAAVIRLDGDGNVRSASAVGATVLEFNGQELSVAP